jgi:hypothetical protein
MKIKDNLLVHHHAYLAEITFKSTSSTSLHSGFQNFFILSLFRSH